MKKILPCPVSYTHLDVYKRQDQSVLVRCNLEYPAFIAWIEQNKPSGLEVVNTGQDMEWLKKHPDMLFPDKSNKAAQWFHIVQHRGQARYYKAVSYTHLR